MDIKEALSKLDISNDSHWTTDGLPALDALKILAGNPALTRDAVNAAAPGYTRALAAVPPAPPAPGSDQQAGGEPADAQARKAALQASIDAKRKAAADALSEAKAAQDELDAITMTEMNSTPHRVKNQEAISAYLEQQKRERKKRGERIKLVKETGVDIKALARGLKAPIDAVRARKSGFGGV